MPHCKTDAQRKHKPTDKKKRIITKQQLKQT